MTRLAGGVGAAGMVEAAAGSGADELTCAGVELEAIGCSTVAAGADDASTCAGGACRTRVAAGATLWAAGAAGLASCGAFFAGTATTVEAPVNPDEGGFTMTGPCGARDAMAGVGAGAADTICGACRGKGTIFRGAGFEPTETSAETADAGAALTGAAALAGLLADGAGTAELPAGAETVGFAAPAAPAVTAGRGGAAVTARCAPCDSRCSFCC